MPRAAYGDWCPVFRLDYKSAIVHIREDRDIEMSSPDLEDPHDQAEVEARLDGGQSRALPNANVGLKGIGHEGVPAIPGSPPTR